jgi:glycerol-3-phosphate acyltransferase PlsY
MFEPVKIAAVIISYFIGNISPAILIGRLTGIDIRKVGSGNAGTTNVLRVLGKKAAVATLFIDIIKGVAAVLIGRYIGGQEVALACCLAVMLGHIWPAVFAFRGGNGIATAFGAVITLEPLLGLIEAAVALILIFFSKRVSVGSIIAALLLPLLSYLFDPRYLTWTAVMAVIVLFKHRANFVRLLKGEEPKVSFSKQEEKNE